MDDHEFPLSPPQTPLTPEARPRRRQSAAARAEARAAFDALPEPVRTAIWARVDRLLAEADWVVARTMPENPHCYTHVRTWADPTALPWVVDMIDLLGERERYNGRLHTVLNRHGFKYWTLWPVERILINRKPPGDAR